MRFILDHFKLSSTVSIALLLCGAVVPLAAAQQGEDEKTIQQDIAALKKDVRALREQQQQILEQLSELTRLLRSNATAMTPVKQPATIDIQGVPSQGNSAATVAIIEYGDFECPACGMYWKEVYPQIEANYLRTGKIKYFFRDLPLTMHPHAIPAARLARCAGEQGKFWEMHDSLFSNQAALGEKEASERARALGVDVAKLNQCFGSDKYSDDIRKSASEAQGMGIIGTPTFFLGIVDANDQTISVKRTIPGAYPYLVFRSYLDELLGSKKQ
jgi:protein-disulfide isomerase